MEYCHSCEPGRRYCEECAPRAGRARKHRAHTTYYRGTPEGRKQHHDEEHVRRRRRSAERRALEERGGDRRLGVVEDELQVGPRTVGGPSVEEPGREVLEVEPEQTRVEWVLVAWPGLLAAAGLRVGTEVSCAACGRTGRIRRVVSHEEWARWRDGQDWVREWTWPPG